MQFDNTYFSKLNDFYAECDADIPADPKLIKFNKDLATQLGINTKNMNLSSIFSGGEKPEGANTIAQIYAGHQFGHFNPQLGDGRALLLGEIISRKGKRIDIQLKGAGRTPFSRNGDGKAGLGPVLREYLVSEAMYALGVPTTRALAATSTGESIQRETLKKGAVLTRTASSHIRIGTFQFFASRQDNDRLKKLADYTIERHYPDAKNHENPYLNLLQNVANKQAYLISKWMGLGFIHGVMNTDNTTLSGETIDYGPCAFMDFYDPKTVFSSIDKNGRYAFSNQPLIARWNMARLAETLLPLINNDANKAIQDATKIIESFSDIYEKFWLKEMRRKFGFKTKQEDDAELFDSFFETMADNQVDFTQSFRALADVSEGNLDNLRNLYLDTKLLDTWINKFKKRSLLEVGLAKNIRKENPIFIPRNHLVEAALSAAEFEDDYSQFEELLDIVTNPYTEHPGKEIYSNPPIMINSNYKTFCGT